MKISEFAKNTIFSIACGFILILLLDFFIESINLGPALLGYSIVAINFSAVIWAWSRIFVKKTIALAFAVIVFKYAILGLILYQIIVKFDVDIFSFAVGISTTAILVIVLATKQYFSLSNGEL